MASLSVAQTCVKPAKGITSKSSNRAAAPQTSCLSMKKSISRTADFRTKAVQKSTLSQKASKSNRVSTVATASEVTTTSTVSAEGSAKIGEQVTVVMKFGGSSVASAERMREVAKIALSFPGENPALVLSAMGSTTNDLLLAGIQAQEVDLTEDTDLGGLTRNLMDHQKDVRSGLENGTCELGSEYLCTLQKIRQLHCDTCDELGVDVQVVAPLLADLERLLLGIALMQEMSPRTKDLLVSFGERMSTRIMAQYLTNSCNAPAKQWDAWACGITSDDVFTNAEVDIPKVLPTIRGHLTTAPDEPFQIPVITGFLAKGESTGAITTLGRGGSDLSATLVGSALGLKEVQVWKDVDGILTTDPRKAPNAVPVPFLTFEEATELAFFGATVLHPQAMRPARIVNMPVRVKNSYNPGAAGTLITSTRDMSDCLMTSIVLKNDVTLVDVVSERKTGFIGFASSVFTTLKGLGISTDVVATSEASITASLDPAQLWSRDLTSEELEEMKGALEENCRAKVNILTKKAIVSLIGNVDRSAEILSRVFTVFYEKGVRVDMISQGASKVNISLVVDAHEAEDVIQMVHKEFFE